MSTPSSADRALGALAVALTLVAAPAGDRDALAQETSFREAIEVNLVNVEVFVSDRKGNPITGLSQKDFTVLEDGRKMKITNFVELRPDEAAARVARIEDEGETVASETTVAAAHHLVLFLDDFAFSPKDRSELIARMRSYVEDDLSDPMRVAVVSYDGNLRLHQRFTSDRRQIVAALDRLAQFNPRAVARYVEREAVFRSALETLRSIQSDGAGGLGVPAQAGDIGNPLDDGGRRLLVAVREIDGHAAQMRAENRRAMFELSQLVNALGSLPGRKAVVHVSQGMPLRPWEELYQAIGDTFDEIRTSSSVPQTRDEQQADINQRSSALGALDASATRARKNRGDGSATELQELTALANASQVSFYTIRPFQGAGGLPAEFSGAISSLYTPTMIATRDANLRETAQTLAESTGGVSFAGDLGAVLERAERDFRGYYSLAYRPEPGRAPGFHELKVKVKGRGYQVRYRKGFFEKPPEARFGDRASAALLLAEDDNPLGLELEIGGTRPAEAADQRLATLVVVIPLEGVTLTTTGPGQWTVDGQLYVAAGDSYGGTAPVQLVDISLPVSGESEEQVRAERYGARMEVLASVGRQQFAIGFVDGGSGVESYVSRELEIR